MEQAIWNDYEQHLKRRGIADSTILNHKRWVKRFLEDVESATSALNNIALVNVDEFCKKWLTPVPRRSKQAVVAALRSFLRFLFLKQIIADDLSVHVIGARLYREENLPKGLPRSEISRVLRHIDKGKKNGHRDYAILMLFAEYGIRLSEVLELKANDIDWEHDKIRFYRPKSKDYLDLPLLPSVGNALFDYIRKERPRIKVPTLFVFPQAEKKAALQRIVKKHIKKAGITLPHRMGSKVFRHSLAMEMVRQNIPFKLITDSMGHRDCASTYIYAKTDIERLREAALPLPGGVL